METDLATTAPERLGERAGTDASPPERAATAPASVPEGVPPQSQWRRRLAFAGPLVALALGIKALLFWFGSVSASVATDRAYASFTDRFTFWNAWDAPHYIDLAQHGYVTTGDNSLFIVFFPGYPAAVAAFDAVLPGSTLFAAFVVSGVAAVTAALLLGYLARLDSGGDEAYATRAVWFLLIFPTAYFLHIPYTESLFMTFVLGAFLAARTGRWATAGVVGALAAATRLNGALLIPALAVEAYLQYRQGRRVGRAWLWIGLVGAGTLLYLGINQQLFGNAFHFQDVQRDHWYKHLQSPYTTIHGMIEGMGGYKPGGRQMLVVQELFFMAIGLVAGLIALFRLRASYGVWALLNVALFASTSFIQSTPRYVLTIFPIFLLMAAASRRMWVGMLLSAWSLITLAWFAGEFALGHWAF